MTKTVNEWEVFYGKERKAGEKGSGLGDHYENFIKAIRANDQKLANGDIRDGFFSCAVMHLGNISYRLSRQLEFDPIAERFIGEGENEANAMLSREYRAPYLLPEVV